MFRVSAYIFILAPGLSLLYAPSIYTATALLAIGFFVSPLFFYKEAPQPQVESLPWRYLYLALLLHAIVGFGNIALVATQTAHAVTDLAKWEGIQQIALTSTAMRYGGNDELAGGSPLLLSINLFLMYLFGRHGRSSSLALKAACFLPFVAYSVLTTAKFPTFLGIAFYLTGSIGLPRQEPKRIGQIIKPAIYLGILGVFVTALAMLNRGHDYDAAGLFLSLGNYLFAQYNALGIWLIDMGGFTSCCQLGQSSFVGPLSYFGLAERPPGIYDTNITLYGEETNIFTAWRFVIEDFSFFGPFFINFVIVAVCKASATYAVYFPQIIARNFFFLSAVLALGTGLFIYNSAFLAFALITAYSLFVAFTSRTSFRPAREDAR